MTNILSGIAVSTPLPRIHFVHGSDGSKLFLYACSWHKCGKVECGRPADWHVKAGLVDVHVCHDHLVGACRHALEPSVKLVGRKPGITYTDVATTHVAAGVDSTVINGNGLMPMVTP